MTEKTSSPKTVVSAETKIRMALGRRTNKAERIKKSLENGLIESLVRYKIVENASSKQYIDKIRSLLNQLVDNEFGIHTLPDQECDEVIDL